MKTYEPVPGETIPDYVEVFDKPKHIKLENGDFYVYAQDPLTELPPEHFPNAYHSFVSVKELTLLGARDPHATTVVGKVGDQIAYMGSIRNRTRLLGVNLNLAPYGFDLAAQYLRVMFHTRRAHGEVKKALRGLQQPNDSLQTP